MVTVKAIHCKKIEVKKVFKGQYCTLEVDAKENEVRKGMVLVDTDLAKNACKIFEVELWNISDKETKIIDNKTHFVISIGHIRQEAIVKTDKEESITILKPEEPQKLVLEFCFNSEFLKEGSHLLILDSNIKCYGVVKKLIS